MSTLFSIAIVAPVFAIAAFAFSLRRRVRMPRRVVTCALLVVTTLAINPAAQALCLESFDTYRGAVLTEEAQASELVGMTAQRAQTLLGSPDYVSRLENGVTIWGYKQLPGYWLGSSFQVFLRSDVVTGFEANDD